MSREADLLAENLALRERLSRLCEATLRINESLDLDTVLQGVLDSARALTHSDYGVVTLRDEAGGIQDFLSCGLTSGEAEELWGLEVGPDLLDYFDSVPEPLRLPDVFGHVKSVGLSAFRLPMPVGAVVPFLSAPVMHRGERVADFFLGRDGGEEYSSEDEETLVMFASQAAMVIANARTYRDEQRARTDLETLVNTSPVGVAVFDARTGNPVSYNREAARIIDDLRSPDQTPEELMGVLTIRRADGREVSLEPRSIADVIGVGETIRAEEMDILVPDGRTVTVLVNTTPICSDRGELESLVATMQDMAPVKELDRMRAGFLAMVSHELRTPLAAIRGSVSVLLDECSDMHPTEIHQFHRIIFEQTDRMRALITDLLDMALIEAGTLSVSPKPADLVAIIGEAGNSFRVGGHPQNLRFELAQDLPLVMADRSRIVQVLANLLVNASRHSPEASTIRVEAAATELHVAVSVSDEGRGIPAESLPHLFRKFPRIGSDEQGGKAGLGLAVSKGIVEAHGGRIWAESAGPGLGAIFTFTLPTVEKAAAASPASVPQLSTSHSPGQGPERVRILAVDDDPEALRYIHNALTEWGCSVIATSDPEDVPGLIREQKPHLVLLDLFIPGADGVELMRDIRATDDTPVIFVSAYGQDQYIARALDMGAEDYVVKPFSPTELIARIRAAIRRRTTGRPTSYVMGDLTIDYTERLVTLAANPIRLTPLQYRMLVELSTHAGRVVTYQHLLERVWDSPGDADLRPMRTTINTLRRKLGDDATNPTYLFTEPRVGYKMPRGEEHEGKQPQTARW